MPVNKTIQIRRDTFANWESVNPILAIGECGLETNTNKIKYGNGSSHWNDLPYFNDLTNYVQNGSNVSSFINDSEYITLNNVSAISPINYSNVTGVISFTNPDYIKLTDLNYGTGISYSNVTGVISNSNPDQVVSISNSSHVSITGAYPNFTLSDTAIDKTNVSAISPIVYSNVSGEISFTNPGYILSGSNVSALNNDANYVIVSNVHNVISGGTTNQVLSKNSDTDYDLKWSNVSSGITDHSLLSNLTYDSAGHTGFQPIITTGTTSQYFKGDLSLATFPTNVSSFSNDVGYITASNVSSNYLKLDTSNGPLTGNLNINATNAELRLTSPLSDYMRQYRSATNNYGYQYNRVLTPGATGYALNISSSNMAVSIPDSDAFSFGSGGTDTPFSISAWINLNSISSVVNFIIAKDNSSGTQREWYLQLSNGLPTFGLFQNLTTTGISRSSSVALGTGQWHHIVATYSGSKNATGLKIYVNDVRVDDTGTGTYTGMSNGTNPVVIGNRATETSYGLLGKIDEPAVFNKELSQADVDLLWNGGVGMYGDVTIAPYNSNLVAAWHLDEGTGTTPQDFSGNARHGTFVNTPTWVTGKISSVVTTKETTVWSSGNGLNATEKGIQTFGDTAGRTVLDGLTTRFNVAGVEKGKINLTSFSYSLPNIITGASDVTQFKVIANATQTTDVFQILASDGTTVRLSQDSKGYLKILNSTGANNIMILGVTNGVPTSQTGNFVTVVGDKAGQSLTSGASNSIFGYNAGNLLSTGTSNIFLGANAGNRQTTGSNILLIDNQDRTSAALELTNSLLYGVFNATPASQTLTVNGALTVAQATGLSTITRGLTINNGATGTDATDAFNVKGLTDQYMIYAKPSTNYVGIGTNAPSTKLHVAGAVTVSGAIGQSNLSKGIIINSLLGNTDGDGLVVNDNITWLIKTDPTTRGLGLFGSTPIAKPTTGIASGTLVSNGGTTLTSTDTVDGYTIQQVVRALKLLGILT